VIADAIRLDLIDGPLANSATWAPRLAPGLYVVSARWTAHPNRATDAKYTVTHASGQTVFTVNQQLYGGIWNLLGREFTLTADSTVTLTDEANGYVIADAVRFVPSNEAVAGQPLYYVHTDHLNTPRLVTNDAQQTVWRWENQEPFGINPPEETPSGAVFEFPLRFPGQYFDRETSTAYNYFRDYDPQTGRYIQFDPTGLRGGINGYAYGYDNPLRYFDFTGLEVLLVGHLAAGPMGRITNPNSYHLALYLDPDDKCKCSGTWPVTIGSQSIGGVLVGTFNYPGDALRNATFIQTVPTPAGMTDCEFIRSLISTAASYPSNLPYSVPNISLSPGKTDGVMGPGQYNSNSFASGVLQGAGAVPPSLNSGGRFQAPGYNNPVPIQR